MSQLTWPEWTDCLGQTYRPGDYVVYAGLSYKSAYVVIGRVDRINKTRVNGEEIEVGGYDHKTKTYFKRPSCSVRIIPLVVGPDGVWGDPKGRWKDGVWYEPDKPSPKTLQLPQNVIKLNWEPA